jgi:hypothetical protein
MPDEITVEELYKLEQSIHNRGECEYVSPHYVLELIDEIKRLRGLPVEKWPKEFLSDEPIAPVEFDFSEILKRRM